MEYDNGKYSARLMQSLADAVKVTVERMIAKPDAALTSISIVSDEEAERIIKIGTGKEIDVDLSKTFANLFTEQAKRTPDAPAVVDRDSQLTYGEMDRYSNALARQLIDFGVQPNDFVCVMLDRFTLYRHRRDQYVHPCRHRQKKREYRDRLRPYAHGTDCPS